jgi:hypothetical protein
MFKWSALVAFLLLAQPVLATELRFSLDCSGDKGDQPAHIARYKVVKISTPSKKPVKGSKWTVRYALEVYFKSQPSKAYTYPFVPAGSGDEDYNEYDLKATGAQQRSIDIQGASIQNRFEWATLVNTEGYGLLRCYPRGK